MATPKSKVRTKKRVSCRAACHGLVVVVVHRRKLTLDAVLPSKVVRCSLPLDVLGSRLGQAEDTVLSILSYAATRHGAKHSVVLLDNVDTSLLDDPSSSGTNNIGPDNNKRLKAMLWSVMDALRDGSPLVSSSHNNVLLVCTSTTPLEKNRGRFDCILTLEPSPNWDERRRILETHVCRNGESTSLLLDKVADCTVGRTYAELIQLCRQAVGSDHDALELLLSTLQSLTPPSVRAGVVQDFVDLRVSTAQDLLEEFQSSVDLTPVGHQPQSPTNDLPLLGESAHNAWKQLQSHILIPFCRANELDALLDGGGGGGDASSAKTVSCGVMLAGLPGTGKTTLARYMAMCVARRMPSIKLLDVSCTSLIHKELGGSERALHRLFVAAREASPCIVLLDGIETVASVRGGHNDTEGTMDRLLSTLLTELDGVHTAAGSSPMVVPEEKGRGGIALIGVTHNVSWIDPALLRPGRLSKVITVESPDLDARKRIVLRELLGTSIDYNNVKDNDTLANMVARATSGRTGADVIAVCQEARMNCLREHVRTNSNDSSNALPKLGIRHFSGSVSTFSSGNDIPR